MLTHVSRSKGNHSMKFGQLEYNMTKPFLEKSYTKCDGDPFLKK